MKNYGLKTKQAAITLTLLAAASFTAPALASPADSALVYVPLPGSCRLVDTRTAGSVGVLSPAGGVYTFGARDADITRAFQSGSATGCGIPSAAVAVSVYFNTMNGTAPGSIKIWPSNATSQPTGGSGVYNAASAVSAPGVVIYSPGFSTTQLNPADGRFNLNVSNGQVDMTVNAVGYWLPLSAVLPNTGASVVPQVVNTYTASAAAATPSALTGGLVGNAQLMPLSGTMLAPLPAASMVGSNWVDLTNSFGIGQAFPTSTTLSSIRGTFVNSAALNIPGGSVTVTATLYTAAAGQLMASATGLSCSVTYSSTVSWSEVHQCTPSGSATVTAGDMGFYLISAKSSGVPAAMPIGVTLAVSP